MSFECLSLDFYASHLLLTEKIKLISILNFIQIRAELGKILQEPDITKAIRERFQGGWREKLLTVLRKSKNKDIMEIMEEAEGLDINDENGEFTCRKLRTFVK